MCDVRWSHSQRHGTILHSHKHTQHTHSYTLTRYPTSVHHIPILPHRHRLRTRHTEQFLKAHEFRPKISSDLNCASEQTIAQEWSEWNGDIVIHSISISVSLFSTNSFCIGFSCQWLLIGPVNARVFAHKIERAVDGERVCE